MKNIIKSISYEIIKSKMMIRIYILMVLVMALVVFLNIGDSVNVGSTSELLGGNSTLPTVFIPFVLAVIVGTVCGSDYRDKVANYEIMSGHSRISIFLSRALFGTLVAAVMGTVLIFVPLVVGNVFFTWGNKMDLSDVVIRHLLQFFPCLRLSAFFVVLTFLIKNEYIMMAVGYLVLQTNVLLLMVMGESKNLYLSIFNMNMLSDYSSWSIYNIDPSKGIVQYFSYDSSVTSGLVIGTIAVSLGMTAFYLFMGYALFRRDELT